MRFHTLKALALIVPSAAIFAAAQDAPPDWAYPIAPAARAPAPDARREFSVPDSTRHFVWSQLSDRFSAPDWHPEDHPPMPPVVARGRAPGVFACGYCHRADGPGGPENASLAGLPVAYLVAQLRDYRSGARSSSLPTRGPQAGMIASAKSLTDAEIESAAQYFAAIKHRANLTVVETTTVPKTEPVSGWFLATVANGGTEPLGERIIEVPVDLEQHENRDARAKFIAWVPVGSIAKGRALATICTACHGADLRGAGLVPPIVGRSPSYVMRQLYDIQHGARAGAAAPMKAVIAPLSSRDMLNLAAYLAAQAP